MDSEKRLMENVEANEPQDSSKLLENGSTPPAQNGSTPPAAQNGNSVVVKSREQHLQEAADNGVKPREKWANKVDFLLACVGFSVGLGNMWRFPYLCYKNGGGAFLIPYFICVIIGGIPVFFLEVSLGQFMAQGGIGVWKICPLLQGIGIASTVIVSLLNTYYNVILAWAFHFLFHSFTTKLPWSHCNNTWNTENCGHGFTELDNGTDLINGTLADMNYTVPILSSNRSLDDINASMPVSSLGKGQAIDPATEYWQYRVLDLSQGIEDVGHVKWDLALCLVFAWIVVYVCICKGIKSSGKVMYFTATTPYLLLLVLMIRGVTLPGAVTGIRYYLVPKWEKLLEAQVWTDAGTQIFFSYSISLGVLTALGSFNEYHHNSFRDCVIFAFTNSGTSLLCGFVIFSILGFMAHEMGVSIDQVAESGPGLAFVAYPKAVAQMPFAPFWSILFFVTIILLGLDSQFVGVEGFVTAIVDLFPNYLRRGYRRQIFIAIVCGISCLIGLSMVTQGGIYVFLLFDFYSGSRIVLVVAFFECIAVAYVYGIGRYFDNLKMMLGFSVSPIIKFCWLVLTPCVTLVIFALCIYSYSELTYNRTYHYPLWAITIGWCLACSSIVMIPLVAGYRLFTATGTLQQRLKSLIRPRLEAHQLRPQDSLKDLNNYVNYTSMNLLESPSPIQIKGVTIYEEKTAHLQNGGTHNGNIPSQNGGTTNGNIPSTNGNTTNGNIPSPNGKVADTGFS